MNRDSYIKYVESIKPSRLIKEIIGGNGNIPTRIIVSAIQDEPYIAPFISNELEVRGIEISSIPNAEVRDYISGGDVTIDFIEKLKAIEHEM